MTSLCLRTSLASTSRVVFPFINPLSSPIFSSLCSRLTTLRPWKTATSTLSHLHSLRHSPFSYAYKPVLYVPATITTTTTLVRPMRYGFQPVRHFHASRPLYASHALPRLANFVAPIILKWLRAWIGTPSTSKYFKRKLFAVLVVMFGVPSIYVYTHLDTTPYTERVRFVALTSDDEHKLGEMAFNQLVDEHESNFIPDHHHFVSRVTEVADRIISASNRSDIKWEVRLIDSPLANAFAIPGGKIFVFSGILDVAQNDDGLAFILGHEVAHVLARHSAEQMTFGNVMFGVTVLVSAVFGDNIGSFILSKIISVLTELKYSRKLEHEADYIGLLLMHRAKYNIDEAPKVWARMVQMTGSDGSDIPFLSTHPPHAERIHDITKWVEEVKLQQKLITEKA